MSWPVDRLILFICAAAAVSAATALGASSLSRHGAARFAGGAEQLTAGLLLATLVLHLLPDTLSAGALAGMWFLLGFLAATLLGSMTHGAGPVSSWTGPVMLGLHSLFDGAIHVSIAALALSWASLPGLVLHEFPETLAAFVMLRRARLGARLSGFGAFAVAGLTTVTGAALLSPVASQADHGTHIAIGAASSGLLLYVITAHLLRPFQDRPSTIGAGALTLGLAAGLALSLVSAGLHPGHAHAAQGPDFRPHSTIQGGL